MQKKTYQGRKKPSVPIRRNIVRINRDLDLQKQNINKAKKLLMKKRKETNSDLACNMEKTASIKSNKLKQYLTKVALKR